MRKYLMIVAQAFNLLFPFLVLPVLSDRLGPDEFGSYAIWISLATFITIVTDWGFNVYGVSETSSRSGDYVEAFRFLFEVSAFKLLFGALVVGGLALILYFATGAAGSVHFLAASTVVFGGMAFPLWFYNGLNKVGYALAAIVPLRLIQLLLVLVAVTTPQDLNLALLLAGLPQIFAAGLILFIAWGKRVRLLRVMMSCRFHSAVDHVVRSTGLFASSIMTASLNTLAPIVLSLFASKDIVGYFYLADRALRAVLSLFAAFSSGVLAERSGSVRKNGSTDHARRSVLFSTGASAIVLLGFFTIGDLVLRPILGDSTDGVVRILDVYIFIIPIVFASNVLGVQVLLPERHYSVFSRNIIIGVMIYWIAVFPASYLEGLLGYLFTILAAELIIGILMYRSCRKFLLI